MDNLGKSRVKNFSFLLKLDRLDLYRPNKNKLALPIIYSARFSYTEGWFYCIILILGMEIGQKVKVYRMRDRVSPDVAGKLGKVGTIKDFKMTDGSGIGAVVEFDDKTSTWFFEDELKLV